MHEVDGTRDREIKMRGSVELIIILRDTQANAENIQDKHFLPQNQDTSS
jgi:hypothetical protein